MTQLTCFLSALSVFYRLTVVMAQSPVCGDVAPCCLSRQPPAASLPPPHPPSRWVFRLMFTVAEESIAFRLLFAHMRGAWIFMEAHTSSAFCHHVVGIVVHWKYKHKPNHSVALLSSEG